jgi:hypothetical protein
MVFRELLEVLQTRLRGLLCHLFRLVGEAPPKAANIGHELPPTPLTGHCWNPISTHRCQLSVG